MIQNDLCRKGKQLQYFYEYITIKCNEVMGGGYTKNENAIDQNK